MLKQLFVIVVLLCPFIMFAQEICDNGIDDDGDGLIDLNDTLECYCEPVTIDTINPILPNSDFETMLCCPNTLAQMNCVDGWMQAAAGTPDYYNTCGNTSFSTVTPLPNSNGFVGILNGLEMIGTCLNTPLVAGNSYSISFYIASSSGYGSLGTIDFNLFGSPNCGDLPWIGYNCPSSPLNGQWSLLTSQSVTFTVFDTWQFVTFTFTPSVNINALSFGGDCPIPNPLLIPSYYYIDGTPTFLLSGSVWSTGHWCTNDLVIQYQSNATEILSQQWFLNGVALPGEISEDLNVMAYGPGLYTVQVIVDDGCILIDYQVDMPEYPVANFTPAINAACQGESFVLIGDTLASTVVIDNWEWDMGDNSPLTYDPFVGYTYNNTGNYDVTLIVSNNDGCADTLVMPIEVHALPEATFDITSNGVNYPVSEGDVVTICGNDSVYFGNLSVASATDSIAQNDWEFGDLTGSTLFEPVHQYPFLGVYPVDLTITTAAGCTDDFYCLINLVEEPLADFDMLDTACQFTPISFTNNSSIALGNIITSNLWSFGNGDSSDLVNPVYTYPADGNFDVTLIVESNYGCKDSATKPVVIWPVPVANYNIVGLCLNDSVSFSDLSTITAGNIDTWQWDLGDGTQQTSTAFNHLYNQDSTFLVSLIVTSDKGCVDTLSTVHQIYPFPQVSFNVEDACENTLVGFSNLSTIDLGSIQQYNWDLGPGGIVNNELPFGVTYDNAGTYNIVLELISDQGCVNEDSVTLTIFETPVADILEDPIEGCSQLKVKLHNIVDQHTANCYWDFGNYKTADVCGVVSTTYGPGVYDVTLTVVSEHECSDTLHLANFITVHQSPWANFTYNPEEITESLNEVNFISHSENAYDHFWDFGDGSGINNEINPVHDFPDVAGPYPVKLVVYNEGNTCADSITKTLLIREDLIFYVPNAFTPNESGVNDVFLPVMTSGIDIYEYKLTIFNRWGEVVFISYNPAEGWDGRYNGKVVQNGVYVWQIDYEVDLKDERFTERGIINVIK